MIIKGLFISPFFMQLNNYIDKINELIINNNNSLRN